MKKILSLFFLFFPLYAGAQFTGQAELDSLTQVLNSEKFQGWHDSDKEMLLGALSYGYSRVDPDKGIAYGQRELTLSEAMGDKSRIVASDINIGANYSNKSDYRAALKYFLAGLQIAESINDFARIVICNNNIGLVYMRLGEFDKSLTYFFNAVRVSEAHNDGFTATIYVNIGSAFGLLGKRDSGLIYETKAVKMLRQQGNDDAATGTMMNMGNAYACIKNYKKARETFFAALDSNIRINDPSISASGYGGIGAMLLLEVGDSVLHLRGAEKAAMLDSAKKYLDTAIKFAKQTGDLESMMEFRGNLYNADSLSGNYKDAFAHYMQFVNLRDSLFSNDNKLNISKMETQREAALKQKQIEVNEILARKKKNESIFYLAGIGLLSLLVAAVTRNANARKKKNKELADEKMKLETANSRLAEEKENADNLAVSLKETITQKDALAEELAKAAEMKTKFLANVSHELRTPVTLLTGMLELMRERTNDSRGQWEKDKLNVAYKNSRKLQEMVEEILDLSRLDNNNIKLNSEPKDLAPVVKRMVYAFETFIEKERLTLEYADGAAKGLCIEMDEDKFEKIINNLVYNAIKFNQKGGWIKVAVYPAVGNKHAAIRISNSGIGIREEDLPHIFERFYQGDTYGAKAEGAGIGLSLVKEFTMLMGGTVSVSSSPAEGTTFTLQFPVSERGTVENEAEEVEAALPALVWEHFPERQTVLLVEDNDEMRYYLREILGDKVNIAEAGNGREALKWLENNSPDLIISDIMMPEMDGKAFIAHLKQDDQLKKLPVITLTALADTGSRLNMLRFGIDDYIVKPFDATELRVRVYNLLSNLETRKQFAGQPAEPDDVPAESKEADEFRNKITLFVLARMKTTNVGVYDLAYELAMSERQLYRLAKSLTGCTPAQLIKEVRLQKAYELLAGGTVYKLDAVAKQVGFEDTNYFARQFYERFGKRATEFF